MTRALDEFYRDLDATPWVELTGDEDAAAYVARLDLARKGKACGHVPKCPDGHCPVLVGGFVAGWRS